MPYFIRLYFENDVWYRELRQDQILERLVIVSSFFVESPDEQFVCLHKRPGFFIGHAKSLEFERVHKRGYFPKQAITIENDFR